MHGDIEYKHKDNDFAEGMKEHCPVDVKPKTEEKQQLKTEELV